MQPKQRGANGLSLPRVCSGPMARREFMRIGALGLGGLCLPDLLAAQAASGQTPPDTSVILFWMWGGPSQLETWDMKPDAPSAYRGPFSPIATSVPGLEICELFPRQAKQAHRFSLIRSLHHEMSSHNDGSIELLTGKTPSKADPTSTARSEHPDFGMIASRLRGRQPDGMPQYVGIPTKPFMTQPGYLGLSHTAYVTGNPSVEKFRAPNLSLDAGVNASRLEDRRALIGQLDQINAGIEQRGMFEGHDRFRDHAFQLLSGTAVSQAFHLESETPEPRDRYGRTPRLTHSGGCLGRDHWPQAQSALIAGGGIRTGQVVGATNSKAEYPVERPLTPQDLLATIYRHLGIDHRQTLTDFSGRPIFILPSGEPIRELI